MLSMYPTRRVHKPHGCRKGIKYVWAHVYDRRRQASVWCIFPSVKTLGDYESRNDVDVITRGTVVWK